MCVDTHAVICFRTPGADKWNTRFMPHSFQDQISAFCEERVSDLIKHGYDAKWSMVPCGQCFECRLQRSRVWANRCVLEMDDYPPIDGICRNWFLTLTYNDDHLDELRSPLDGMTLSLHQRAPGVHHDHLQNFNDALRRKWKRAYGHEGIRFYACGEYGDKSARPHYHELVFNLPIDPCKLEYLFSNSFGDKYYNCKDLEDAWSGKGFVVICEANWQNAAYTARYIMKKQTGNNGVEMYDKVGILPPFVRMSLKPGIGFSAFKGYSDYISIDELSGEVRIKDKIVFPHCPENVDPSFKPPRYFDRLMDKIDPDLMQMVKDHRERMAKIAYERQKAVLNISDQELFAFRQEAFDKRPIGMFRASIE